MSELKVGTIHAMEVTKQVDNDYILLKKDKEIVLKKENCTKDVQIGEMIDIFLFHNRENELEATMHFPDVTIGTYGWAKVIQTVPHLGAFVNIGLPKEILLPYDELPAYRTVWPQHGDKLYVTLTYDKQERLLAKLATEDTFDDLYEYAGDVALNTKVTGKIIRVDREGAVLLSEENYRGFIHHTEVEREPRLGETVEGRVIEAKENGSINVSLLPMKHERIDDDAEKILQKLHEANGVIPFTDKSSPEQIRQQFQMSKSNFKRALGRLMRERKIEQKDGQTFLLEVKE